MLTKLFGVSRKSIVAAALVVASGVGFGCQSEYDRQRPPLDEVVKGDRGLQSKDVLIASDEIAAELLSLPELNDSPTQWALTIDRVEDRTTDRKLRNDYQIFLERLRTNLSRQGRGRIALLENRDRLRDQQSRELDLPGGELDEFEQGGEDAAPALPGRIQPRFILYAKASDLPNRATTYYFIDFIVTDIRSGRQVFVGGYEVRVSRT